MASAIFRFPSLSSISSFRSLSFGAERSTDCRNPSNVRISARFRGQTFSARREERIVKVAFDEAAATDELGNFEVGALNPSVSSSYRSPETPKPNQTVLEAQAKVCTGPTQTRPLSEEQAFRVLDTILRSGAWSAPL